MKDLSLKRLQFALTLISISIIAFQLALIQIISFLQWYHFAYMIISIAMLGFGTAGTVLSLFKEKLLKNSNNILPILMILSGLTMPAVIYLSQTEPIRFDTMLFFTGNYQIVKLLTTYILFTIPFFFTALAIGIIFTRYSHSIGKLYFSNLVGSGLGGLLIVVLLWIFFPEKISSITGLFAFISGLVLFKSLGKIPLFVFIFSLTILTITYFYFPDLEPSEFKIRSKTLLLQDSKIIYRQSSPHGVIEIISSPMIRSAEGLSLKFTGTIESGYAILANGDLIGNLLSISKNDSMNFLNFTTSQLPFVMGKRDKVLILNSGSGSDVLRSLYSGARSVTAVEPNSSLISILTNKHPELNDSVYLLDRVMVYQTNARSFVLSSGEKYDLVILPTVDAFGGTSGFYSLREQFHLTREAINDIISHLNSDGTLMVNVWLDYPPRNSLKVFTTIVEALEKIDISQPRRHITAIKNWNYLTIAVKATPITANEENSIKKFCDSMLFDMVVSPNLLSEERDRYNKLFDDQFYDLIDKIFSSKNQRENLYDDYAFNIIPATDDKPFFSRFLRLKNIIHLKEEYGSNNIPFFELGYILLYVTLIQIIFIAVVLIILPLFKLGFSDKKKFTVLLYFGGIGLAYMFIEIIFIQMYTLYFGNPIYSVATVICLMLVCSGIGSYVTHRFTFAYSRMKLIFILIVILILIQAIFLKEILFATIHFSLLAKIIIALIVIAPSSFFMGMPFPIGIKSASEQAPSLIPWAWGINGFASVIATVLATVLAVEIGFTSVFFAAAVFYSLVLISAKTFK